MPSGFINEPHPGIISLSRSLDPSRGVSSLVRIWEFFNDSQGH